MRLVHGACSKALPSSGFATRGTPGGGVNVVVVVVGEVGDGGGGVASLSQAARSASGSTTAIVVSLARGVLTPVA